MFWGAKKILATALKSYIRWLLYIFFFIIEKFEKFEKTGFFRANTQISNLNVLHKGLLLQDWVFRLGFCSFS